MQWMRACRIVNLSEFQETNHMSLLEEGAPRQGPRGSSHKKGQTAQRVEQELIRRVPPHSADAEMAVIAGVFLTPAVMNTVADIVTPEDFYLPAHATIYRSFLRLYADSTPIDLVTAAEDLKSHGELEQIGGMAYLIQLAQAVVSGANAEYYAGYVRDRALQRRMIDTCSSIIRNCMDPSPNISELLDESEQAVFAVSSRRSQAGPVGGKDMISRVFENLTKMADARDTVTGITTGFERLDQLTSGYQNSDLIIVAARPSMGKSAFALSSALSAALTQKIAVAIFSLEMSSEQVMQRMLSIRSKVDMAKLRRPSMLTDEDWLSLQEAGEVLSGAQIFVDDSGLLSTVELRARARRLKAEHNLGLVVVDYLQLMHSARKTDSREQEISDISRSLKGLAKELNIPVVALAQLNRKVEDRTDKRPILADLRESGAIEQDADVIMFVYRDDVYKYKKPSERPLEGEAEIIIGKQRNGPVGVAELMYLSQYTAFVSRAPDYMPATPLPDIS